MEEEGEELREERFLVDYEHEDEREEGEEWQDEEEGEEEDEEEEDPGLLDEEEEQEENCSTAITLEELLEDSSDIYNGERPVKLVPEEVVDLETRFDVDGIVISCILSGICLLSSRLSLCLLSNDAIASTPIYNGPLY